jgi:DNA-directed RNA polymerase subunit RPC12/RpoP
MPVLLSDNCLRCARCNKKLAEKVTRPWRIQCVRCSHTNLSERSMNPKAPPGLPRLPLNTDEQEPLIPRLDLGDWPVLP